MECKRHKIFFAFPAWLHRIPMKPPDSFLTSEEFCDVLEFFKFLLACAAGGVVAGALKKGNNRCPLSLLCGQAYFIVSIVLQRNRLFKFCAILEGN